MAVVGAGAFSSLGSHCGSWLLETIIVDQDAVCEKTHEFLKRIVAYHPAGVRPG